MNNFDYKKYLAEGSLFKEDINYDEFDDKSDIKSLLELGAKATVQMGEDKLYELSESFENWLIDNDDNKYEGITAHLDMAIELVQEREPKEALPHLRKFNQKCKEALAGLKESVNEESSSPIEDVRLYIQKELGRAGEQDAGLDAYIESLQRDFKAGGDRSSAYADYEMDDYLEDFENYVADKMDY